MNKVVASGFRCCVRAVLACLLVYVLVMQSVFPPIAMARAANDADPFGIICTSAGVPHAGDAQQPVLPLAHEHCAMCNVLHDAGGVPVIEAQSQVVRYDAPVPSIRAGLADNPVLLHLSHHIEARGPPSLI